MQICDVPRRGTEHPRPVGACEYVRRQTLVRRVCAYRAGMPGATIAALLRAARPARGDTAPGGLARWLPAAGLALVVLVASSTAAVGELTAIGLCDSLRARAGTQQGDIIHGTDGPDVFVTYGGHDVVFGHGGDDVMCGGLGDDYFYGGDGDDRFVAEPDASFVGYGHDGQDTFWGGDGRDTMSYHLRGNEVRVDLLDSTAFGYEAENDVQNSLEEIVGGSAKDYLDGGEYEPWTLRGGPGPDSIRANFPGPLRECDALYGDDGYDRLYGDDGGDCLHGGPDDDVLEGGGGLDDLDGDGGADDVYGGDGRDTLEGGDGADELYGGADADWISDGGGIDDVYGGDGDDFLEASGGAGDGAADVYSGGSGTDDVSYQRRRSSSVWLTLDGVANDGAFTDPADAPPQSVEGDNILIDVEGLLGGPEADIISAEGLRLPPNAALPRKFTFLGGDGVDTMTGSRYDDMLIAGSFGAPADPDVVTGGPGEDYLFGGGGADVLSGDDGADFLDALDGDSGDAVYGSSTGRNALDDRDPDTCQGDVGDVLVGCP